MDTSIASPTAMPQKTYLKEADEVLDKIWHEAMNSGLNWDGVGALIWDFLDSGKLSCDEADHWMEALSKCPEGYDLHVDSGRSWCAYCGSVYSRVCDNCGSCYDLVRYPERFWFMHAQVADHPEIYCEVCWMYIGAAYRETYGTSVIRECKTILPNVVYTTRGNCKTCDSRIWCLFPLSEGHTIICARCHYSNKAVSLAFEHSKTDEKIRKYYADHNDPQR